MKIGCSSQSFETAFREGRMDLRDFLRACGDEMHLDGVELLDRHFASTDAAELREIKRLCLDQHLTIAAIGVTSAAGPDGRRVLDADHVRRWCDIAAVLGAPIVRVFAGWAPRPRDDADPGRIVGLVRKLFGARPADPKRAWSDAMYALRSLADYAGERGVALAVQNARADGIIGTPAQLAQTVHDAGASWLRICLDPADLLAPSAIDAATPRTVLVHARSRDIRDDGSDPAVHWPEVLRRLKIGRYRGYVIVDYAGAEDPERAAPRAARFLSGALHFLERQQMLAESAAQTATTNGSGDASKVAATPEVVAGAPSRQ